MDRKYIQESLQDVQDILAKSGWTVISYADSELQAHGGDESQVYRFEINQITEDDVLKNTIRPLTSSGAYVCWYHEQKLLGTCYLLDDESRRNFARNLRDLSTP